jgi:hypothetical protein
MTYLHSCLAVLVAASAGCGLIDSDVTNFDLTLPDKNFSIDTAGWQIDQTQAQALLNMPCNSSPTICNQAAQQACTKGCSGTCNTASNRCELMLDVGLYQQVDLVNEKPELKSIDDQPVIKVTIDSVTYDVKTNTLNVATPELRLSVAPMSVMDPKSPDAVVIGTIPPVLAGATVMGQSVEFTADGKTRLVDVMSTFKTPFNVIVGSSLVVKAGQQVPTGKLDAVLHIRAHAGL